MDDIWDSDEEVTSVPRPTKHISTVASDEEDEVQSSRFRKKDRDASEKAIKSTPPPPIPKSNSNPPPKTTNSELDDLFDLSDLEDDFTVSAPLDIAQLQKEADARNALHNLSKGGQTQASAIEIDGDDDNETPMRKPGKGKVEKEKDGKRVIPKLDDERSVAFTISLGFTEGIVYHRLLGKEGFPALLKEAKAFKIGPKGNEVRPFSLVSTLV